MKLFKVIKIGLIRTYNKIRGGKHLFDMLLTQNDLKRGIFVDTAFQLRLRIFQ